MKKLFAMLCIGGLMVGMIGCGNGEEDAESQSSSVVTESSSAVQESSSAPVESSSAESSVTEDGAGNGHDYTTGWTEEMMNVRTAVVEAVGEENYWPNMPLTPDLLETSFGLTAEMYEDYLAEMPMISVNVDTLVIVKAKEGQLETVQEALNTYRDAKINDSMQYPMNLGKVQASKIEVIGDYVCFVQLGGDTMAVEEQGEEAVIAQCQEANDLVIETLKQQLQ